MRCSIVVLLLAASSMLTGCSGKGEDSGGIDSSAESDTDTGTPPPADFTFALTGDHAGTTLTLTWIDFASLSTTPVLGDAEYSAAVAGDSAGVAFGEPPEADLQEVDPTNAPGLKLAGYIPALHVDSDGDGVISGAETYAGVGLAWPVYVTGELPTEYADLGLVDGWNALEFSDAPTPAVYDITSIPLDAGLAERTSITFGGAWTGAGDELVVLPSVAFDGGSVSAYLYDDALTDPWSVTLDGAPDADHFEPLDGVGDAALEVPIAYTDGDHSGDFTANDTPVAAACWNSLPVGLIYLPGVSDLITAWSLAAQGVGTGWVGITLGDTGGTTLSDADLGTLALDDSCSLG